MLNFTRGVLGNQSFGRNGRIAFEMSFKERVVRMG
jgi:hypothetical protein